MDMLKALRGKTDQAEVYRVQSESTSVSFEANEIKSAASEEAQGIALRAMVDGRLGFTAASGVIVEQELIDNLLASAQFGDAIDIAFPAPQPAPEVMVYDPTLAEVSIDRFVEIGREIVEAPARGRRCRPSQRRDRAHRGSIDPAQQRRRRGAGSRQ